MERKEQRVKKNDSDGDGPGPSVSLSSADGPFDHRKQRDLRHAQAREQSVFRMDPVKRREQERIVLFAYFPVQPGFAAAGSGNFLVRSCSPRHVFPFHMFLERKKRKVFQRRDLLKGSDFKSVMIRGVRFINDDQMPAVSGQAVFLLHFIHGVEAVWRLACGQIVERQSARENEKEQRIASGGKAERKIEQREQTEKKQEDIRLPGGQIRDGPAAERNDEPAVHRQMCSLIFSNIFSPIPFTFLISSSV